MMKKICLLCQVIFVLFLLDTSYAQVVKEYSHPLSKSLFITLEAGSDYSLSDYESSDLGLSFGGSLEYYLPSHNRNSYGLKLSLAQHNFSGSENNLGLPNSFDTEMRKAGLGFIYTYAINNSILPFVNVGASYLWLSFDSENVTNEFIGSDLTNDGEKNTLLFEIIGGLRYRINDYFDMSFGLGYNYVQKDNLDAIKYGEYEDYYLSGQIGFSFRIWNEKDTDGDGILDPVDKCPYEEEDIDGFEDEDGCPDPDNDNDGILDIDDACQNIAEDIDGFQDDDGCPDPDNDGDGVLDIDDDCQNIAEDIDGFQDDDGCPDADNDGDGILDEHDQCVDAAENFNGFQDDDGCPDELPEPVYVEPEPKIIVPTPKRVIPKRVVSKAPSSFLIRSETTFGANSSDIKSSAYGELNGIVNELKKYPNTSWRIEGHTDRKASRSEANRISRSQADAILNYFVTRGLSSTNFQAIGFGDASPIASNSSVYGKMKNRRIIIRKID
jgi:outer membrane protein OmpA-like peptidoglycan-associated protein/opacity protein-like surface antigen